MNGANDPLTESLWQGAKTLLSPGRSLLFTPQMLGLVRGITTGGSTIHYYATSFPVPFDMLKNYGIDIRNEVKELREELPVASLKDDMVGPMSNRIMQSANELGYNWKKLEKFMYQDRWEPGYKLGHYGDPHGVKWNARMYVEEALANGAKLINGAKVKKVLFDEGYMMADMAHPFATTAIFAAGVFRFDKMFSRKSIVQIMVKAKDELGGNLTDKGGVRKILDKKEKQKLERGYEKAKEILKNAGAKGIFKTPYLAAHPGGTVKVGDLLDSNLMTKYHNLFVCDCSVIPEAWGLPPTTTIIALGKRLAKYLSRETG